MEMKARREENGCGVIKVYNDSITGVVKTTNKFYLNSDYQRSKTY